MKVLHNTDAYINGKFYREGNPIPKEYEEEFKDYLIEKDSVTITVSFDDDMSEKKPKNISKKKKDKKL